MLIDDNAINAKPPLPVEQVVLALSVIGTIFTLGWVLWFSRYGLDFTDESFYLVWISNPFNYSVSVTQFGFIYHPLYELLSGDIAKLRQANILITFCLAWVLGNVFLKTVFETQNLEAARRLIISAALATTSLLFLATNWIPTPSYNSLALQALFVAATGLLLAKKESSRTSFTGWVLIGIGGWLAFMAKPTTAAALGACSVIYLLLAGKLSVRLLAISLATATALLVLGALTIDGSISGFIDRMKDGIEVGKMLGGGHTIAQLLRLDDFRLGGRAKGFLVGGTALVAAAAYCFQTQNRPLVFSGALLSISFVLLGLAIACGFSSARLNAGSFQGLLIWVIPFAAILVGLVLSRFQALLHVTRSQWAIALSFLVFPHIYAFGTGGNYWSAGSSAGIFWILAGLALLGPIASTQRLSALLLPLALAAQLVTVVLVDTGIQAPYRQPPLRENDYVLEIGKPGSKLVLSKSFGHYFTEVNDVANRAGFKKGTPMIDLTGQFPGTLYALGASSIGQAWNLGGYPGSDALAAAMLQKVSCEELARAWLLAEPENPGKISPDILASFDANMITDFEIVGTFKTAEGTVGHKVPRTQQLHKPVRSVDTAMAACSASRALKK